MALVLDASAVLPWCFQDEATEETGRLLALADGGERIYVPAHWPAEVLNGLTRAARRGRVDEPSVDQFLKDLIEFNIAVDARSMTEQWTEARPLIRKHRLSAYDAAYLALAKRLHIELATFDEQLRIAAQAEGVPLSSQLL